MKYLAFLILLLLYDTAIGQRVGEEIKYNEEKGIYFIHYWSETDSTFYEVPLFPGNKAEPKIEASVNWELDQNLFQYQYILSNKAEAVRELYIFAVTVPSPVSEIEAPNHEWRGRYLEWMEAVRWSHTNSRSDTLGVLPGENVNGIFAFSSPVLPGIIKGTVSSYHNLGNTPDEGPSGKMRATVDSLLAATKEITLKTIGPRTTSDGISNVAMVDTLQSYLSFSCDTTWIANQGICRSLEANLDKVERQLERGNTRPASGSLQAFLNELNALKEEEQISSEAYALLFYNGEFLLEKLEE